MYQAQGVSITAGSYGMASELGDPSERADRTMPETAARRGARSRVLVVDDEPEIVAYLRETLEGLGYEVSSARDGREALERVAAQQPDLILLDCVMPRMDGVAVCQALRLREETRLLPILMVTALTDVDSRVRAFESGVDDVVAKPFDHRELVTRIHSALTRKHAIDQRVRDLQRARDHFSNYVPDAVKHLVMANRGAPDLAKVERDVTVLFVDISGYTRLAERLPAHVLNALVERYFSAFFDRLTEAGGDINETMGDGLMVIFQHGGPEEHATHAVDAALMLLALTEALNHTEVETPLAIHIGINSGGAYVGSTHFEGRRGTRWTFTASGLVTAVAARLAGLAQDGQIVAGPETVRRLGDRYRLDPVGAVRLKNITEPIEAHRIFGPSSSY
jgi:DNA-binding response OmpR family regulator